MRRIAFLDFDGTITTRDTLLEFIKFSSGEKRFYIGFAICSPYLFAYKLGIISNQRAKEKILQFFFKGMTEEDFNARCNEFAIKRVPSLLRVKAMDELQRLSEGAFEIVVVSASPFNWILPWAADRDIRVIATRLVVKEGRITGKISGKNCHGREKVRRIREEFDLQTYDEVLAYGDSSGDKPMLAIATQAFFKPFR